MSNVAFWLKAHNTASIVAAQAHSGQLRKDGKTPYIVHPARVAQLVCRFGGNHPAIIAAWYHDILEDCPGDPKNDLIIPSLKQMNIRVGSFAYNEILYLVEFMTKDPVLNSDEKELEFLSRLPEATAEAGLLKICDRIDNLLDIPNCLSFSNSWKQGYLDNSLEILGNLPPRTAASYPVAVAMLSEIVVSLRRGQDPFKEG